ncbi:hypothetical protein BCL57_000416 [Agromyces flavus]|uniref:Uncharacterized protein n=1 Tax=Agromyces flavus TaxID=589382 RepID=A0A1H1WYZ4_9MICO|nr:hypothetical protein [Agromyces flavus]MCP2366274.1 hypothetical protein [Agromyces flavus]GGI44346.1 hypothetical protein GCM10010932_04150 [Agromyces flavus]SDT01419.1 hypothetical protein SAMN04489721_2342 [Agromyces flavus]
MNSTRDLTESLIAELEPHLADTAYTISRTERGFEVLLDLADAKWWMPLSRNGLEQTFAYQVAVDEAARNYSVNDVSRTIEWKVGVGGQEMIPSFGAGVSRRSGSITTYQRKIEIGISDRGAVEPVVDIAFDSAAVKKKIHEAASRLGLNRTLSRDQRIGLWFGIGGLGIAAATVLMIVVVEVFVRP